MQTQLKTLVGAAVLATLVLAGMLGIFTFSASRTAQADGHSATRSFSPASVVPGGEVTVTVTFANFEAPVGSVAETLPAGFAYKPLSSSINDDDFVTITGQEARFTILGTPQSLTYVVTASSVEASHDFSGTFLDGSRASVAVGGTTAVTVTMATGTTGGNGEPETGTGIKLSSQEPGARVQIIIRASAAVAIGPNQDIMVDLSAFRVPATIPDAVIDISSDGFDGNPSNVVVTGNKVTMTVPNVKANGDDQNESVMGDYSIRIKQSAGIENAASGGEKTVRWVENAPNTDAAANKEAKVVIQRVIKLSTTYGVRGTMTKATFKGFSNGTATVNLNDENLDQVTIADNAGTLEIDTTSTRFLANREGGNEITATDGSGNSQDVSGKFTIDPKIVLDPRETSVAKMVNIKLSDWPENNAITEVKIGATISNPTISQSTDGEGNAEFMVLVPADANRGSQTVRVTGTHDTMESAPSASAPLRIDVLSLTVQPAMVVPGQQLTIQGSGFVANDSFDSVNVGGIAVPVSPAVRASSAGDMVITINIPSPRSGAGIGSGKRTISVSATGSNRVAEGEIEISKAAITLSPEISRRGSTVTVSGTGFPSGDLVQVKYEDNATLAIAAAGAADASGAMTIEFVVPNYAKIGATHNIEATSVGVYASVTAKATHMTPGARVTLSTRQISSGENIIIVGVNFPAFAPVAMMRIGGLDVRPVPSASTSVDGDFEATALVPHLGLGNQTVSIRVGQTTITTFLEIVGTIAQDATDPTELFMPLGDRLLRVWYLERSTQMWSFYDPDPEAAPFNTLTQVSSGQNVSIMISPGDDIGFQDKTLYPGTNPIALD